MLGCVFGECFVVDFVYFYDVFECFCSFFFGEFDEVSFSCFGNLKRDCCVWDFVWRLVDFF